MPKPSPSPSRARSRSGSHKLRIAFTAQIHRSGPGLYYVDYRTDSGSKRLISSHLAPADARRVFPVWDEPALKATFALTVTVPRAYTAVSNMPVAREDPAGPNAKKISFSTTPKMSSYLVELTAGELEQISGEVDGVAINVFTIAGKREQGRFALQSAIDLLRYFNDYFGLKYPLPKLDLIAIPNGHVSAMEHWGAITFSESYLLFDPRTHAGSARRGIFALIAHEIAHQWFGNLVTMTLVGQSLAQRRLRHLDGIQGDRAFPSALADLAQQLRREAGRDAAGCQRHRASDPPGR